MDGTKELIPKNIITVDEELDEFSNRPVANSVLFKKFQESAGMQNPMTAAGDIIVGGTSGAPSKLAKGSNGSLLGVNSSGNLAYTTGLPYTTTAPTAANTDGIKIAVLSSEPATKYSGWLYLITGE